MTKSEAVSMLFRQVPEFDSNAEGFLRALEVLGLIKFDEEKTLRQKIEEALGKIAVPATPDDVFDAFEKVGLKIVKS